MDHKPVKPDAHNQIPPSAESAPAEIDLGPRLRATITMLLDHLEAQIAVVGKRLAALGASGGEGFDVEVSRAGAALARALKEISGELRQLERHDKHMTITPEQRFAELLKYVRTLDSLQLDALANVVDELQSGRAA